MKLPLFLVAGVLLAGSAGAQTELIVAADGSGRFTTVQQAVDAAPAHSLTRIRIHIKPGTYKERVTVPADKPFLGFIGDDAKSTVITFDTHAGTPGPDGRPLITFGTPTVFVQATDFQAENVTFQNSAGPQGQALALTIMGDRGVFRNCRFLGYQDTLLAQAGRQYFERCYIEGAVDFIFGGSAAWFEDCDIHVTANGYITAANTTKDQEYGYVFSHCRITGAPGVKTFLGRPWRPWAATVFLNTEMSDAVRPEGWNNWNDPAREKTVRYAEYQSTGPGAGLKDRVKWAPTLTPAEAERFTPLKVLAGMDGWDPKTGAVKTRVRAEKATGTPRKATIPRDAVWIATASGASPQLFSSADGLKWSVAAGSLPAPSVGQKQMLDPRLLQGPDGTFHLVWATAPKGDKGFGYAGSKDLVHWSVPKFVEILAKENALDLASPNLFYDEGVHQFIVTWACTMAKNFIQSFQEEVENNPRIWYTTTHDFETFADPKLLFDNNYAARDGQIVKDGSRFALVHNDNTWPVRSLRVAFAAEPLGPWGPSADSFAVKSTESPAVIRSGSDWWIFDSTGLVQTRDFLTFTDASSEVSLPAGVRLLSILEVKRGLLAASAK